MAKKVFTSESFNTLLNTIKTYIDNIASAKANISHTHTVANVANLQESLDNKAASSHTHTAANITDLTATVDELNYIDGVTSNIQTQLDSKANSSHNHSASNITSGTLSSDRLPTVPIAKGGTGATTAAGALTNLGITATATELNYVDGVTSNIQTQLNSKASSSHTHSVATTSASGLMSASDKEKLNGIASGANAYIHPTYTARTGVPTANATLTHGGTFTVTQPICDATGHITAMNTRTYTLPSDNNTDTKVTNTLATTTKAYITGTTSSTTNTGTQVFDTGVYLDTVAGKLTATTFNGTTFSGSGVATVSEVETYLAI